MTDNERRGPGRPVAPETAPMIVADHLQGTTPTDLVPVAWNGQLAVTVSGTDRGNGEVHHVTWADVLGVLAQPVVVPNDGSKGGIGSAKASAGWWVFGTFRDGKRDKAHLLTRSALTADLDHGVDLARVQAALDGLGIVYAWHSTYQSTPAAPRLRVIVPLSREVDGPTFARLSRLLWDVLGVPADTSSDQASRIMYRPATPDLSAYQWTAGGVAPADVDTWLAQAPGAPQLGAVDRSTGGPVDRFVVDEELAKLKAICLDAATWLEGQTDADGKTWDDLVARVAFRVAGLTVTPVREPDGTVTPPMDAADAEALFEDLVPDDMRDAEASGEGTLGDKLRGKLRNPRPWPESSPRDFSEFGLKAPAPGTASGAVLDERRAVSVLHPQTQFAYALAAKHQNQFMHVSGLGWLWFDGKRWREDNTGKVRRALRRLLGDTAAANIENGDVTRQVRATSSAAAQNGVLEIASTTEGFAVDVSELDQDPWLLNVANGTLDLRTQTLKPHDPADRITKVTRGAWTDATDWRASRFGKFLAEVLPDEAVRGYLQRYVGLALVGEVREH